MSKQPSIRARADRRGLTRPELPWPRGRWRRSLAEVITDPLELLDLLGLQPDQVGLSARASCDFALRVPRAFVRLMTPGDADDPLLKQVLPSAAELRTAAGFVTDPLQERSVRRDGGVLHKYEGRVLLIVVGACAVHCRYCFRRHYDYERHELGSDFDAALSDLSADPSISEVILSGGDPLTATDSLLSRLARALDAIAHLRRLRLHTRQPVVLPDRVDDDLLSWLEATRLSPIVVIHANHRRELGVEQAAALAALRSVGVTLLNQSVLLRGVNDSASALEALSERLFELGVLPYYLHQLDRVQGAAHFQVDDRRALELEQTLRARLPGYLVPRLVRELSGAPSKLPLGPKPVLKP